MSNEERISSPLGVGSSDILTADISIKSEDSIGSPAAEQSQTSRLQEMYVKPAIIRAQTMKEAYPIASVFIAFFLVMSAVPVMLFCGCSLFVAVALLCICLSFALLTSLTIISAFGVALMGCLVFITLLASFFTVATITLYASARLFTLVRTELHSGNEGSGKDAVYRGVTLWMREMREAVLSRAPSNVIADKRQSTGASDEKTGSEKDQWNVVDGYKTYNAKFA